MEFEPELGQMAFGNAFKEFAVSEIVEASLMRISRELERVMWNELQRYYESPFANTGNRFKNETFEVNAYDWNDDEQPYNFKWKDIEISWYKYCGRGLSSNVLITPEMSSEMLNECLESLRKQYDD